MRCLFALMFVVAVGASAFAQSTPEKVVKTITEVGAEGKGNAEAATAWKELVGMGTPALPAIFSAIDGANPNASNWLRLAVGAIAEKEKNAGKKLPAGDLETYTKNGKNGPVGRRLAYELLVEMDPKAPSRLLPTMIDDPSIELRRDAIQMELDKLLKNLDTTPLETVNALVKLFPYTRDQDQVEACANAPYTVLGKIDALKWLAKSAYTPEVAALEKPLLEATKKMSIPQHFNVVSKWMILGPLDASDTKGFTTVFAPEKTVDLKAEYESKEEGKKIKWVPHTATGDYGVIDFNKALGKHKLASAFAYTEFTIEKEQPIEIRLGTCVTSKVYLNGKEIFAREEYHHGQRHDQYIAKGTLKPGKNTLLVKVVQNNQTEPWAQEWQLQLRICDSIGTAVPVKITLP